MKRYRCIFSDLEFQCCKNGCIWNCLYVFISGSAKYASSWWLSIIGQTFWNPGVTLQFSRIECETGSDYNSTYFQAAICFLLLLRLPWLLKIRHQWAIRFASPPHSQPFSGGLHKVCSKPCDVKRLLMRLMLCACAGWCCAGAPPTGQCGLAWSCTHGSVWHGEGGGGRLPCPSSP